MRVSLLFAILSLLTSTVSFAADDHILRSEVSFAPVTFSLGCKDTTEAANRHNVQRGIGVVGYVKQTECVDSSKQVVDARITKLAIGQNEKLGNFSVILVLGPEDAKKLAALTQKGNPQAIVLSVKGHAVVSSYMNAPFEGNQFWITADTLEDARRTADLFNR